MADLERLERLALAGDEAAARVLEDVCARRDDEARLRRLVRRHVDAGGEVSIRYYPHCEMTFEPLLVLAWSNEALPDLHSCVCVSACWSEKTKRLIAADLVERAARGKADEEGAALARLAVDITRGVEHGWYSSLRRTYAYRKIHMLPYQWGADPRAEDLTVASAALMAPDVDAHALIRFAKRLGVLLWANKRALAYLLGEVDTSPPDAAQKLAQTRAEPERPAIFDNLTNDQRGAA